MKKLVVILLIAFIGKASIAQNYNPAVNSGTVTPAPLIMAAGIGSIQFNVGNTGNDALSNLAQPMVLIITFSYGVPNNVDPIAAITGTYANRFNWIYDPLVNSYQGTQNQVIPGLGLGTIQISYRATLASTPLSPQNGFNVNVIPPAYTNSSNASGDDNVSSYTYGPAATTLPVKLAYYNASVRNCVSTLNWKSSTETNFRNYEVEYSKDGIQFQTVSTVNSRGENSVYTVSHNADQGKAFYRLKLVDNDGKIEYSRIIVLDIQCGKASVLVYPNPAKDFVNVNITGADARGTMGSLFNMAGQIVLSKSLQNGSNQLDVSRLAQGVYQLRLVSNTGVQSIKIIID
jgi:hypothetical protein